jgi:hypothetical protein
MIVRLIREERPLEFFASMAVAFAVTATALSIPLVIEYSNTGLVPRLPTAVLSTGLMVISSLSLTCGLVLATVTRGRMEAKRLQYLTFSSRLR